MAPSPQLTQPDMDLLVQTSKRVLRQRKERETFTLPPVLDKSNKYITALAAIMTQLTALNPENISENKLTQRKWISSCFLSHSCSPLHFSLLISHFSLSDFLLLRFSAPFLYLHSLPLSYSLSISKGQMFPAVTVALHWYAALNLAKSHAAVSASSNHTAIWHRAHRAREKRLEESKEQREMKERQQKEERDTDRPILLSSTSFAVLKAV